MVPIVTMGTALTPNFHGSFFKKYFFIWGTGIIVTIVTYIFWASAPFISSLSSPSSLFYSHTVRFPVVAYGFPVEI